MSLDRFGTFDKTFLRLGRLEQFKIRVTNMHSFPESPMMILDLPLENVPSGENLVAYYRVLDAKGQEVGRGVFRPEQASVTLFLPPIRPFETADFTLLVRVAPENRTRHVSRIDPLTFAVVVVVSSATVVVAWVGSKILSAGSEIIIKRQMKLAALNEGGMELSDEDINQMYNALKQSSSFAADWLRFAAQAAGKKALKEYITRQYGDEWADAVGIVYDVATGTRPLEALINFIAEKLVPGINWSIIPAKAALQAFFAEAERCLKAFRDAQALIELIAKEKSSGRLRVTFAYDPNSKSGSLGVDGFVSGDATLTYTIFFENLPTATAAAEEILLEDVLQSELDLDSLTFVGFSVGDREVTFTEGEKQLAEDIDFALQRTLLSKSAAA